MGVLRGYDVCLSPKFVRSLPVDKPCKVFLNIVLDDAVEEKNGGERVSLGMVVSVTLSFSIYHSSSNRFWSGYPGQLCGDAGGKAGIFSKF